jgi:hypothetical protein
MGPHFFEYTAGELAVSENREPVRVARNSRIKRRLNRVLARIPGVESTHTRYASPRSRGCRSVDFGSTITRSAPARSLSRSSSATPPQARSDGTSRLRRGYFAYHERNEVDDSVLTSYAPRVHERLALCRSSGDEEKVSRRRDRRSDRTRFQSCTCCVRRRSRQARTSGQSSSVTL